MDCKTLAAIVVGYGYG